MLAITTILVGLIAAPLVVEGQQGKVPRVGVLTLVMPDRPHVQGLRDGLKAAGYVEGKNLVLNLTPKKSYDELRAVAREYKEQKVDLIVTVGTAETAIAREVTQDIPIVFMPASDPIRSGFVKSLSRPGTNLTGLAYDTDLESRAKRLEVFKEIVPKLRRVVMFYNARDEDPIGAMTLEAVRKVSVHLGIQLTERPVVSMAQVEQAVSSLSQQATDGVFLICTSFFADIQKIAFLSRVKKLPLSSCASQHVAAWGALFTYAPDLYEIGRRAAWYVDRILKGAQPHDLPVETPTKYQLVINLKTAKEIGLIIPPDVLIRADQVIK